MTACEASCAIGRGGLNPGTSHSLVSALGRFWKTAGNKRKSGKNKIATSPRSVEIYLGPLAATGWRNDFTHPQVGQAERLACRKRLPNAFLRAEARTHFFCPAGPIDNFLITLPVWYGYPQKFLVCCRSRKGSGGIPDFYAEVMEHGSPNQKPGDRLPGHGSVKYFSQNGLQGLA